MKKTYFKKLDYLRVFACLLILFYHLGILKGGYLAVSIFFVLSGYLSCLSLLNSKKVSFKDYYKNKIIKLYIPLILVVFLSVGVISLFPSINFLNLKPESTSVIFGYNNYWQLSVNLDYFARHLTSPFMHLWYIAILLQFDLIFPFIFIGLKKVKEKTHKLVPSLISFLLAIVSFIWFSILLYKGNIMGAYYGTFARSFSLFLGVGLAFLEKNYKNLVPKKYKKNKYIPIIYIVVIIILSIFVDSRSILLSPSMIIVSLITMRLISYAKVKKRDKLTNVDNLIKKVAKCSYLIYLIQYPIIYIFQYININSILKMFLIIILVFVISYVLHFCLTKNDKMKEVLRKIILVSILIFSLYGLYIYIVTPDYTKEMKNLEKELLENEKSLNDRQQEYYLKVKEEDIKWNLTLTDLENEEKEIAKKIVNLPVVGIGDSVLLGAVPSLYKMFPNGYFDGKVSRTAWSVKDILNELKGKNSLGNPIIFNLGTNGDCSESCKDEIVKICGDREIFWVNVTNDQDVHVNDRLEKFANKYQNVHLIDWNKLSSGHSEYFAPDKIHLTASGREYYASVIKDAIYKVYLEKYQEKKNEIIKEHDEEKVNKISFYGNNLLLNLYKYIEEDYSDDLFMINKEYNYNNLKTEIENAVNDNSLTKKVVLAFDNKTKIGREEYQELINLSKNSKIYIIIVNEEQAAILNDIENDNVVLIDFYEEIKKNDNYLMNDKVHLTKEGNEALKKALKIIK